jgi:hypothetical protein
VQMDTTTPCSDMAAKAARLLGALARTGRPSASHLTFFLHPLNQGGSQTYQEVSRGKGHAS